jgi:hypothetical protein
MTMARPFSVAGLIACALPLAAWADGPAPAPAPAVPAPATQPAPPPRLVSSHIAAELAATAPTYQPPPATAADQTAPDPASVRMPAYLVREPKLPTAAEVLTRKGLASIAMDRYLGSTNDWDRGVLNHFTLVDLWHKVPVLGQVPFVPFGSITNESRAMERYDEDQRLQEKADLLELVSLMKKDGDAAGGAKLKQEVDDTFK